MNPSPSVDHGVTPSPAGEDPDSFARHWRGSEEELRWLEESLREELSEQASKEPAAGAWVNPLDGLRDDSLADEELLKIFIDDALMALDDLTALLLALEGRGSGEAAEQLVAFFHRIKGSAAMIGLKRAARLAHSAEDALQQLLDSGGGLRSALTDAMLKTCDALREYAGNLAQGVGRADRLADAARELHSAGQAAATASSAAVCGAGVLPAREKAGGTPAPQLGEPAVMHENPPAVAENAGPRVAPESHPQGGQALRVGIVHLDRLMGLAGQLTIQNARLHTILERFQDDPSDRFRDLFEAIDHLDRISDAIRRGVMDVRMAPIGPLLQRYHRVVRDLTRTSGKLARLEIVGEKTELDKRMIDELGDPLLQIVRNALDHGIEHPEVRVAAGKTPDGLLSIRAFHRGNSILIQVADDGAGLDLARLREAGVAKGVVTPAEAAALSTQQVEALIWKPGMSTARQVTEVSGRGVGMDIVRAKVEGLHGTVEVESQPGRGTTFSIRLPLTLAILPCLMIVVDGETFAVPIELVKEIVALDDDRLREVCRNSLVRIRDRVLATVRLDQVFTWRARKSGTVACPAEPLSGACTEGEPAICAAAVAEEAPRRALSTLLIVGERGRDVGLLVDRVLGQEDVVIKSLAENYCDVPGIAGATILGDGRVALILDIPGLLGRAL